MLGKFFIEPQDQMFLAILIPKDKDGGPEPHFLH